MDAILNLLGELSHWSDLSGVSRGLSISKINVTINRYVVCQRGRLSMTRRVPLETLISAKL